MKRLLAFLLLPLTLQAATVTNQITDGSGNPVDSRVVITPYVVSTVFGGTNVLGLSVGIDTTNGAWGANLLGGLYYVDQGLGQPKVPIFSMPGDVGTNNLAYYAALATNPIPSFFVSGSGFVITVSNFNAQQFIFANNQISILTGALVTNLVDYQTLSVLGQTTNNGIIYLYDSTGTNIIAGFDTSLGGWFGPGLGGTNIVFSTNVTYYVSSFPGPSNNIVLNNTYWNYTATGNTSVTNVSNVNIGIANWATLNISNQTSGNITGYVTVPFIRAIGGQTTPVITIPSGKVGMWSFLSMGGLVTNYVSSVQDAIADAVSATNYVNQVSNALYTIIQNATNTALIAATNSDAAYSNTIASYTVTVAGTANQIASSVATAQALYNNPATTLSLPNPTIAPGPFSASQETNRSFAAIGVITNDANGKTYTTPTLPLTLLSAGILTQQYYDTNSVSLAFTWVGPSNTVPMDNGYHFYTTTTPISFTNIVALTGSNLWSTVEISNQTAASITGYCTIPGIRIYGTPSVNAASNAVVIPSGKTLIASFWSVSTLLTNAAISAQSN